MSQSIKIMSTLQSDLDVRSEYLSLLKQSRPNLGVHSMEKYWHDAMTEVYKSLEATNASLYVNPETVKYAILLSAEYGLSFNPKHKECYLEITKCVYDQRQLVCDLGLKYNGLKSRLVKSCGVKAIATEVVHKKDTFEWRGQWKEPYFVMSNETSEAICCFGVVERAGNRFMSYKMSIDEMTALENADVQRSLDIYGDENASFYRSPYRKRMFEIATLRYIYRELVSLCEDESENHIEDNELNKDHLIAMEMESDLAAQLVSETQGRVNL